MDFNRIFQKQVHLKKGHFEKATKIGHSLWCARNVEVTVRLSGVPDARFFQISKGVHRIKRT